MKDKNVYIQTQAVCKDEEGNFWFTSNSFNALFFLSVKTLKIEYVTSFDETDNYSGSLYTRAYYYKGKILLIPCVAEHIAIYDIAKKSIRYVYIEKEYISYNCTMLEEGKLLMFPAVLLGYAWFFSFEQEKIVKIPVQMNCQKDVIVHNSIDFLGTGKKGDNCLYVTPGYSQLAYFNIKTFKLTIEKVEGIEKLFATYGTNTFDACKVLSASDNKVIIIDEYDNKQVELPYKYRTTIIPQYGSMAYTRIVHVEKAGDIVIPVRGNQIRIIENNKTLGVIDWNNIHGLSKNAQPFVDVLESNNKVFFFPYECDTLLIYDIEKNDFKYIDFRLSYEEYHQIITEFEDSKDSAFQRTEIKDTLDLAWFIDYVRRM